MSLIAVCAVVVPLVLAIVGYPLGRLKPRWRDTLVIAGFALNVAVAIALVVAVLALGPFSATLFTIAVPGFTIPVGLMIDGFNASLALSLAVAFLAVALYSTSAPAPRNHAAYFSLLFLAASGVNGFVASSDLFALYLFWEVVSISFLFLVMVDFQPGSTLAGLRLYATNEVAGLGLLLAVLLTLASFQASEIGPVATWLAQDTSGLRGWIVLLLLVAMVVRGGLVPVHTWLMNAVGVGRFAVGALLLSALGLLGLYAMLRLLSQVLVADPSWAMAVGVLGAVSVVVAGYSALRQADTRRIIGYHGLAQFGFVALGLGLGSSLGIAAAVTQMLGLAFILPLLFLAFAVAFRERGEGELSAADPGAWPLTAMAVAVGGMAAVGLPPLMGFGSRWLLYQAGLAANNWWATTIIVAALAGSVLAITLFIRLLTAMSSIEVDIAGRKPVSLSPSLLALLVLVAAMTVVCAPWILFLEHVVGPITATVTTTTPPSLLPLGWPGIASFLLVCVGFGLGALTWLAQVGPSVAGGDRLAMLNPLRSVTQFTSSLMGSCWEVAQERRLDLSGFLSTIVLESARLVSGVFLIIARRVGGW